MSDQIRFVDLPLGTVFWSEGSLYEKDGQECAVHHATGGVFRFYGTDRVYPVGSVAAVVDDGLNTDPVPPPAPST